MIEGLILWQFGSARAEAKSRARAEQYIPGQGLMIFLLAVWFLVAVIIWPFLVAYRTKSLKKWPAVAWPVMSIGAIFTLLISPFVYTLIGVVWGMIELGIWIDRNDPDF